MEETWITECPDGAELPHHPGPSHLRLNREIKCDLIYRIIVGKRIKILEDFRNASNESLPYIKVAFMQAVFIFYLPTSLGCIMCLKYQKLCYLLILTKSQQRSH